MGMLVREDILKTKNILLNVQVDTKEIYDLNVHCPQFEIIRVMVKNI